MNFSEVIKTLNNASAFDLYRMRAAIDRVLDEPRWMQSVQVRLKVGQAVQYFDPQANALRRGRLLEMRRKQAVVLDIDDARRWLISYAAINLDGSDVQIRENKAQGLGRNEVAMGEVVGFVDRDQNQRTGRIIRLNDKTVTLQCGPTQWRVAYALLHRVRFASPAQLQAYLEVIWTSEHCVLSGLKLDVSGGDLELAPSLDRIDSSKHYEPGNLQVVARFINRWKRDDEQGNFVRLLKLVKAAPTKD